MTRIACCLLVAVSCWCLEYPPPWVVKGILHEETRSKLNTDGSIRYVDRSIGAEGERGCFQMKRIAFDTVKAPGERFEDLDKPSFAEYKFIQYMRWLRRFSTSWDARIMMWNAGPNNKSTEYLRKVRNATN